jgi:hypothetical protein
MSFASTGDTILSKTLMLAGLLMALFVAPASAASDPGLG